MPHVTRYSVMPIPAIAEREASFRAGPIRVGVEYRLLTDAIAADIGSELGVYGYRFRGQRFDCGSKAGFLQATVAFGLARDDLREDLHRYLTEMIQVDKAAE